MSAFSHLFSRASLRHTLLLSVMPVYAGISASAQAQQVPSGNSSDNPWVISASAIQTSANMVASSVTVLTSEDLQRMQRRTVADALQDVPGLFVVQTGGIGGQTSLFMRGTNSNHTKIIMDGIDISDPSNPTGIFDVGQLLTSNIERIEILRGPQGSLYGADSVGGVIMITTKKGVGAPKVSAQVEAGSFGTFNQNMNVSGSHEDLTYSFGITHNRTENVPVTPKTLLQPDQTPMGNFYDNVTYSSKVGARLSEQFSVDLIGNVTDSKLLFTDFGRGGNLDSSGTISSAFLSDQQSKQSQQKVFTRAQATWLLLDGRLKNIFGVNYTNNNSKNFNDSTNNSADAGNNPLSPLTKLSSSKNQGDRNQFDWKSYIDLGFGQTLLFGAEKKQDNMAISTLSATNNNVAGYAEYQAAIDNRYYLVTNFRSDHNDAFGNHQTWRVAPAYILPLTETKLKASYGTAYKAPTLFELYDNDPVTTYEIANPHLRPETSKGYEFGFEQPLLAKKINVGSTYFDNQISNLIQGVTDANWNTQYININSASIHGVESFVAYQMSETIKLRADYTHTIALDNSTGEQLLRRPKDKESVNVTWLPLDKLNVSATLIHVSSWSDIDRMAVNYNTGAAIPSKGNPFTTMNLAASYQYSEQINIFARIDNLFNQRYQNPVGFLQPGFAVYGGMRVSAF
jgi:vitamin B12 transporter